MAGGPSSASESGSGSGPVGVLQEKGYQPGRNALDPMPGPEMVFRKLSQGTG